MDEAFHAELLADARGLVAAERDLREDGAVRVDADRSGAQSAGDAELPRAVLGPERARQAVRRVVREPDRLVLGLERDHGDHRAEDLLAGDDHVVRAAVQDGGAEVEAAVEPLGPRAALEHGRPFLEAARDVALDRLALAGGDEWPHLRLGRFGVADHDRARRRDVVLEQLVLRRLLDE